MTCTHCGTPSTQPSGHCTICAPATAWPQPEPDAPSGLVAPPTYDVTTALPHGEDAPSGLPQFGGTPAPAAADVTEELPPFAPPVPADPRLVSQYNATLPAAEAEAEAYRPAPAFANATVAAQYIPSPTYAPPAPQYHRPYARTFPVFEAPAPPGSILSVVAIVLAAFAVAAGFYTNPFVPAAGAVVCAAIGLRRGERLAKLGLILGIVATVYSAFDVIALVLR